MSSPAKIRILIKLTLLLAFCGVVLSYLSLEHHVVHTFAKKLGLEVGPSFCNMGDALNCDKVNTSSYSSFLGIPVASYGLFYFAALFIFSFFSLSENLISRQRVINHLKLFALSGLLVCFVLFLISKFIIKVICPLCLGVYLINILLFTLMLALVGVRGWFQALRDGFIDYLMIPDLLLGRGNFKANDSVTVSRLLAVTVLLAGYSTLLLEDHFVLRFLTSDEKKSAEPIAKEKADVPIDLEDGIFVDYFKGSKDAPVKIIEFADFECPACRDFHLLSAELLSEQWADDVLIVFRNFPLDNSCNPLITEKFHENSCYAAEFARCAGEQGKFWSAADYLFFIQDHELSSEDYKKLITDSYSKLGLDPQGMEECLKSDRHIQKIQADAKVGAELKIQGTPAVWINGKLATSLEREEIISMVEQALNPVKQGALTK